MIQPSESDAIAAGVAAYQTACARARSDYHTFARLVLRDEKGHPIQYSAIHRLIPDFMTDCWARGYYAGVLAMVQHGKCGPYSSPVTLASGEVVPLGSLLGKHGVSVLGFDETQWSTRPCRAVVVSNGSREVFRLRLWAGREVEATGNHPYLTVLGWKTVDQLKVGDAIAVVRGGVGVSETMTATDAALLGYFVGNGGCTNGATMSIGDDDSLRFFVSLVASRGWSMRRKSGKYDHNVSGGAIAFIREHGLYGKKSIHKIVPSSVMAGGEAAWRAFLGAYFDCDGGVEGTKRSGSAVFSSMSRLLLVGCQQLFSRLGLPSAIRLKMVIYKGAHRPSWTLTLWGDAAREFFKSFPISHGGKLAAIERVWAMETTPRTQCDVVPIACVKLMHAPFAKWRKRVGLAVSLTSSMGRNKFGISRTKVERIAAAENNDALRRAASLTWDRIVSIESIGTHETYAMQTGLSTYLQGDVISHNSLIGLEGRLLWEIGRDPNLRARVVSGSDSESDKRVGTVKRYAENVSGSAHYNPEMPEYHDVFPHAVPAPGEAWTNGKLHFKRSSPVRDPTLEGSPVIGIRAGASHDYLFFDDPVTAHNTIYNKLSDKVYEAIGFWLQRVTPDTRVGLLGFRHAANDAYSMLMQHGGSRWRWLVVRVSEDCSRYEARIETQDTVRDRSRRVTA